MKLKNWIVYVEDIWHATGESKFQDKQLKHFYAFFPKGTHSYKDSAKTHRYIRNYYSKHIISWNLKSVLQIFKLIITSTKTLWISFLLRLSATLIFKNKGWMNCRTPVLLKMEVTIPALHIFQADSIKKQRMFWFYSSSIF